MAKGYQANKERLETINALGKAIGKRASFKCEWCEGKEELRIWDYKPEADVAMERLALLCGRCRAIAGRGQADVNTLHAIRNALWSDIPAVAEGAARLIATCKEPWAREAIEESLLDDMVKTELLR